MSKIKNNDDWLEFAEEVREIAPVYYSNEIARMRTKFTLEEEKIIHYVFSKLKPFEKNPLEVNFSKKEFFKLINVDGKSKYRRYKSLLRGIIHKTYVELIEANGDVFQGVVVTGVKWGSKTNEITVYLNEYFMPYISELLDNFTKLSLLEVARFKSQYSLIIYRWLMSWNNAKGGETNGRYITTAKLKELLGLTKNDYVYDNKFQRTLFENNTIDVAVEEINDKTNLRIEYKKVKEGNSVKYYAFHFVRVD